MGRTVADVRALLATHGQPGAFACFHLPPAG